MLRGSVLGRIQDRNIWRVYIATLTLGLAYGAAISVIGIFLDERGFSKTSIGTLAAWFAAGIITLSIPAGALIRRFSAKKTLVVALVGYAATVGAFPFFDSYPALAAIRFVDGACSVAIWVSCETILLARARPGEKAFITSLYAMAIAIGYIVGPLVARVLVAFAPLLIAFVVAGVIALATAVYVAARLEPDDGVHGESEPTGEAGPAASGLRHNLGVLWKIKTSCFATFAYGYFQASVVIFLPLYLIGEKSVDKADTVLVPAFFATGMLLAASFVGRIGDRVGHLLIMRVLGFVGMTMVLSFVFLDSFYLMCAAIFVAGATLATISPVSLALQGVVVQSADYSRATAIYNAFYAAGMLLGPPASSVIFEHRSGASMLYHLAALWALFVAFAWIFRRDDPATRPVQPENGSSSGGDSRPASSLRTSSSNSSLDADLLT